MKKNSVPQFVYIIIGGFLLFAVAFCANQPSPAPQNQTAEINTAAALPTQTITQYISSNQIVAAKTCDPPPAKISSGKAVNSQGILVDVPPVKLAPSEVAIAIMNNAAKTWSADARLAGGYGSSPQNGYFQGDKSLRLHYGQDRGAEFAWNGIFFSESKKQEIMVAYVNGAVQIAAPQNTTPENEKIYRQGSVYEKASDLVSSCIAYETAKQNGLDDNANYYIISNGSLNVSPKRTWIIWELSRTENDASREVAGKFLHSYIIDATTGELIKKTEDRV